MPTLVEVVVQGGVGPRLGTRAPPAAAYGNSGSSSTSAAAQAESRAVDAASVAEALESLVAIGQAGGQAELVQGGALAAGAAELERLASACGQQVGAYGHFLRLGWLGEG